MLFITYLSVRKKKKEILLINKIKLVIDMEIVKASRDNLASVLMGKNIQFPWRGQNNVVINVPFAEWLSFVQKYKVLLQYRKPLNYERMLQSQDEGIKVRYFLYDMSWALYSELACSSNVGKNATLILPYFDDGEVISIIDVVKQIVAMGDEQVSHYHNSLKAITRNYYGLTDDIDIQYGLVDVGSLSEWNTLIYEICIYLQSRSSAKISTSKQNIDWRLN